MSAATYPVSAVTWDGEERSGHSGSGAAAKRAEQAQAQQDVTMFPTSASPV